MLLIPRHLSLFCRSTYRATNIWKLQGRCPVAILTTWLLPCLSDVRRGIGILCHKKSWAALRGGSGPCGKSQPLALVPSKHKDGYYMDKKCIYIYIFIRTYVWRFEMDLQGFIIFNCLSVTCTETCFLRVWSLCERYHNWNLEGNK